MEQYTKNGKFHIPLSGLRYAYNEMKRFSHTENEMRCMLEKEIYITKLQFDFV